MHWRVAVGLLVMGLAVGFESGCATKKYVRTTVAERVQPLENRTSELEETSRRNTQDISQLNAQVTDVRGRADKAEQTADQAAAAAEQANNRVASVETSIEDLKANLDKYSIQTTAMVFFKPGSDLLTREAAAQLDQLASQITDRNGFLFEITGYGDMDRPARYNQNLAQLRAEAVERYLADKNNVPVMRMFAIGFGTTEPATQNVSSAGASQQSGGSHMRRVEIKLLTNKAVRGDASPPRTGQAVRAPDQQTQERF